MPMHSTYVSMERAAGRSVGLHARKAVIAGQNLCITVFPQALMVGMSVIVSDGDAGCTYHHCALGTQLVFLNLDLDLLFFLRYIHCGCWWPARFPKFTADVSRSRIFPSEGWFGNIPPISISMHVSGAAFQNASNSFWELYNLVLLCAIQC